MLAQQNVGATRCRIRVNIWGVIKIRGRAQRVRGGVHELLITAQADTAATAETMIRTTMALAHLTSTVRISAMICCGSASVFSGIHAGASAEDVGGSRRGERRMRAPDIYICGLESLVSMPTVARPIENNMRRSRHGWRMTTTSFSKRTRQIPYCCACLVLAIRKSIQSKSKCRRRIYIYGMIKYFAFMNS